MGGAIPQEIHFLFIRFLSETGQGSHLGKKVAAFSNSLLRNAACACGTAHHTRENPHSIRNLSHALPPDIQCTVRQQTYSKWYSTAQPSPECSALHYVKAGQAVYWKGQGGQGEGGPTWKRSTSSLCWAVRQLARAMAWSPALLYTRHIWLPSSRTLI